MMVARIMSGSPDLGQFDLNIEYRSNLCLGLLSLKLKLPKHHVRHIFIGIPAQRGARYFMVAFGGCGLFVLI